MKIEEAMIDLSIQREVKRRLGKTHGAESIGLGIEALKRDQNNRLIDNHPDQALLPGETEE